MNTKLTLKLEDSVIHKAKVYARSHRQSLSKLVENFFRSLTEKEKMNEEKIPPTVKSLAGIIKSKKKIDAEKEYTDYLIKKYR